MPQEGAVARAEDLEQRGGRVADDQLGGEVRLRLHDDLGRQRRRDLVDGRHQARVGLVGRRRATAAEQHEERGRAGARGTRWHRGILRGDHDGRTAAAPGRTAPARDGRAAGAAARPRRPWPRSDGPSSSGLDELTDRLVEAILEEDPSYSGPGPTPREDLHRSCHDNLLRILQTAVRYGRPGRRPVRRAARDRTAAGRAGHAAGVGAARLPARLPDHLGGPGRAGARRRQRRRRGAGRGGERGVGARRPVLLQRRRRLPRDRGGVRPPRRPPARRARGRAARGPRQRAGAGRRRRGRARPARARPVRRGGRSPARTARAAPARCSPPGLSARPGAAAPTARSAWCALGQRRPARWSCPPWTATAGCAAGVSPAVDGLAERRRRAPAGRDGAARAAAGRHDGRRARHPARRARCS